MSNEQQGQGQGQGQPNPNKVPPSTDKKEFKKDVKQQPTEADEEMDNGACADKSGSCGSGIEKKKQ